MTLRPLDMQVMLPRLQKMKSARETVINKEANAAHQEQIKNRQVVDKKLQKVNKFEQKEDTRIKREEKRKGKHDFKDSSQNKKKKSDDNIHETEEEKKIGHGFDMKI